MSDPAWDWAVLAHAVSWGSCCSQPCAWRCRQRAELLLVMPGFGAVWVKIVPRGVLPWGAKISWGVSGTVGAEGLKSIRVSGCGGTCSARTSLPCEQGLVWLDAESQPVRLRPAGHTEGSRRFPSWSALRPGEAVCWRRAQDSLFQTCLALLFIPCSSPLACHPGACTSSLRVLRWLCCSRCTEAGLSPPRLQG